MTVITMRRPPDKRKGAAWRSAFPLIPFAAFPGCPSRLRLPLARAPINPIQYVKPQLGQQDYRRL